MSLENGEKLKPKKEGKDQAILYQLVVSNEAKWGKFSGYVQQFKPLKSINEGIGTVKAAKFYLIRAE